MGGAVAAPVGRDAARVDVSSARCRRSRATDRRPTPTAGQAVDSQRLEGQAVLALADAAMAGQKPARRPDFTLRWQNAFLKAQQGTFVPFTLVDEHAGALPGRGPRLRPGGARGTPAPRTARPDDRGRRPEAGRGGSRRVGAGGDVSGRRDFSGRTDSRRDRTSRRVSRGFSIAAGRLRHLRGRAGAAAVDRRRRRRRGRRC